VNYMTVNSLHGFTHFADKGEKRLKNLNLKLLTMLGALVSILV